MTEPKAAPAPELTDQLKALLIALGNFILLVFVLAVYWFQDGVSNALLIWFVFAELVVILWCFFQASIKDAGTAVRIVFSAAQTGVRADGEVESYQRTQGRSWVQALGRFIRGLWPVVILNFGAIGYLMVLTGGPITSPFATVPILMLAIGQLLVEVPPVSIPARFSVGVKSVMKAFFRSYWPGVIIGMTFYVVTMLLKPVYPDGLGPVPPAQFLIVTGVNIFVTSIVALCTRSASIPSQKESLDTG